MQCLRASFSLDFCGCSSSGLVDDHPQRRRQDGGAGSRTGSSSSASYYPTSPPLFVIVSRGSRSSSRALVHVSGVTERSTRRGCFSSQQPWDGCSVLCSSVDEHSRSRGGGLWTGCESSRELSKFGIVCRSEKKPHAGVRVKRHLRRDVRGGSSPRATLTAKTDVDAETQDGSEKKVTEERVGVLLLNLGGPETLNDVQPFLYNLFADPDIIRLPRLFRFLQQPLAQFISTLRAPKSTEAYASIGGGSPLRKITDEQADALAKALQEKDLPAQVYVGMRYWHPFTEEAIHQIKLDGITRLVVLPLYPQFSISTSGSSLRLLESIFREDEYLVNMQHTVIPSWYQREGYVQAMATLIEKELVKFDQPDDVNIFFSAHGVPVAYVEDAGDPYKAEMEECVDLITRELRLRGVKAKHTLAYQSRVGPVEWLKPYTDATIVELGKQGVKSLLAVPISFVSEHIETLEEIDMEYRELAHESGIVNWGRVPALNCDPTFITDLADAVLEALPYVGAMAVSNLEARQSLVPLGKVEELLATYDIQRRGLPAPVAVWEWGWTKSAETWNGRVAMLAVVALLVLEVSTGQGVLHQWGLFPFAR